MHAWHCLLCTNMPCVQTATALSYVPELQRLELCVTSKPATNDYREAPVIKGIMPVSRDIISVTSMPWRSGILQVR